MKFYTNKDIYRKQKSKITKNNFKLLAAGRINKYAVAQLIDVAQFSMTAEQAALNVFQLRKNQLNLTKEEKSLTEHCFAIGQSNLSILMHKTLLSNTLAANSMKLLAQLKNYIDDDKNLINQNQPATKLKISLTKKKQKKKYKEINKEINKNKNNNNNDNDNTEATPLKLVM